MTETELQIPVPALAAMGEYDTFAETDEELAESARQVAAPVVVAELRRMADALALVALEWRKEDDRTIRSSALGHAVRELRARADALVDGASS